MAIIAAYFILPKVIPFSEQWEFFSSELSLNWFRDWLWKICCMLPQRWCDLFRICFSFVLLLLISQFNLHFYWPIFIWVLFHLRSCEWNERDIFYESIFSSFDYQSMGKKNLQNQYFLSLMQLVLIICLCQFNVSLSIWLMTTINMAKGISCWLWKRYRYELYLTFFAVGWSFQLDTIRHEILVGIQNKFCVKRNRKKG